MRLKQYVFSKNTNIGFFFLKRKDGFFHIKLELFQNCWAGQFCLRMRIKWYYFWKMTFFHLNWGLCEEIRKIRNSKNYQKFLNLVFFSRKTFFLLKGTFSKTCQRFMKLINQNNIASKSPVLSWACIDEMFGGIALIDDAKHFDSILILPIVQVKLKLLTGSDPWVYKYFEWMNPISRRVDFVSTLKLWIRADVGTTSLPADLTKTFNFLEILDSKTLALYLPKILENWNRSLRKKRTSAHRTTFKFIEFTKTV